MENPNTSSDIYSLNEVIYFECGAFMNNLESLTGLKITSPGIKKYVETETMTDDEALKLAKRIINMIYDAFIAASRGIRAINVPSQLHEFALKCIEKNPQITEKLSYYLPAEKDADKLNATLNKYAKVFLEITLSQNTD